MLDGRRMLSFTSSGAPEDWLRLQASWDAIRTLFDNHLASVCGLEVLDHVHFGAVAPNMTKVAVMEELKRVEQAVARLF